MKLCSEEGVPPSSSEVGSSSEGGRSGLKLGIIRLGRAGGKTKYALLDENDISLVEEYSFEARLEIDKNGNGARIDAYAYLFGKSRWRGQVLQDLLWEKHRGGIAPGFRVVHKNGIPVDNRLDNLILVHESKVPSWYPPMGNSKDPCSQSKENSLYWMAIAQLPPEPLEDHFVGMDVLRVSLGEGSDDEEESFSYYECRHPPCTRMEQELREFSICGRCQEARYCGIHCQQRDWPVHKRVCREKRRVFPVLLDRSPQR